MLLTHAFSNTGEKIYSQQKNNYFATANERVGRSGIPVLKASLVTLCVIFFLQLLKINMKIAIFILFVFISIKLLGQQITDWSAFNQRIDVKKYEGKRFRLQAAVKVDLIDSSAEAEIWARVDRADHKRGFFYDMTDKPIRSKEWQVYTIEGRIDKGAEYLTFGGLYYRKGFFFFDDFKLSVETSEN